MTEETTEKPNIYQRMNRVMADVTGLDKTSKHAHFKYAFAGHEACTAALRGAYVQHGIVRTASVVEYFREDHALRMLVAVRWTNIDNPADFVEVNELGESFGEGANPKPTPVQTGIALSYAVKNAEFKAFSLKGDSTPDAEDEHAPNEPAKASPAATAANTTKPAAKAQASTDTTAPVVDPEAPVDVKQTELEQRREALATDPPMTEEQQKRSRTLRERLGLNAQSAQKWLKQNFDVDFTALGKPGGKALADRVIAKLQAELEAQNKAAVNP